MENKIATLTSMSMKNMVNIMISFQILGS